MSEARTISARGAAGPVRVLALKAGAVTAAAAVALDIYGAYGNQHQMSAVPFVAAVAVIVTAVIFGGLVPPALRAIAARAAAARRWCLGHGIAAVLLVPVFWSGVPLIVGSAAILLAVAGRRQAGRDGSPAAAFTVTLVLGLLVVVGSIAWTVIGNMLLSR